MTCSSASFASALSRSRSCATRASKRTAPVLSFLTVMVPSCPRVEVRFSHQPLTMTAHVLMLQGRLVSAHKAGHYPLHPPYAARRTIFDIARMVGGYAALHPPYALAERYLS